jgi:HAD superfamily hydrolase (TIGR01509 family)
MKPSAVILDRDGVLTYFDVELAVSFYEPLVPVSVYELFQDWEKWGAQVGFPSSLVQEKAFFAGFWQSVQQIYDLPDAHYRELSSSNYLDYIHVFPEVAEVLRELKQRGAAVGVLSNFSLASLESSLEAVGIRDWIDVACAATVIGYAKPQPESYQHVAWRLQVAPEACLFFDDEMPCVLGAEAVGMTAYLVDRKRSQDERSSHVVHSLTSVLDLFP